MKNHKQPKVDPRAHHLFTASAQASAIETARRVAFKLEAGEAVVIHNLDKALEHGVTVYERVEKIERNSWSSEKAEPYCHLVYDVLVNPAKLPVLARAKEAHDKLLPLIQMAQASAPGVRISYWNSLVDLVEDSRAISCVFRVSVRVKPNGEAYEAMPGGTFTACSYQRRDGVKNLNAVEYGSKTGAERLLVVKTNQLPHRKGDSKVESWAGNNSRYDFMGEGFDPINVERVINDAVTTQVESWGCLCDREIQDCVRKLTPELIREDVADHLEREALKAHVTRLSNDIHALGLVIVKGPDIQGKDYSRIRTLAVTASPVDDSDRPDIFTMMGAKDSLEALHKALVK